MILATTRNHPCPQLRINLMHFPATRLRRLRSTAALRSLVSETRLHPGALIYPLFVCEGEAIRRPVASMPGVFNLSIDEALKEVEACAALGLGGILLFGIPAAKDDHATGAYATDGIVQRALRAIKQTAAAQSLVTIADVCLCEYTAHGHCGIVTSPPSDLSSRPEARSAAVETPAVLAAPTSTLGHAGHRSYEIDNDATLPILAKTAVSLAQAGADIVAPSDMMDGRVAAIRSALDAAALTNTPILSYASKFASAFYGPFREAAGSTPQFGDRRTYQMDGANLREAMREIVQDIAEGADMLLMKPALPYLDVIREARQRFDLPLGAYQVSGEYSMLQAAFERNWLDPERAILESLTSIRRAGADFIVTYFAKDAAKLLA
jgi:porphobilinogen synthase